MPDDIIRELVPCQDQREVALLREIAAEHGVEVEEVQVRDIMTVMAVFLVGGAAVVNTVIRSFTERRKGGQIIDLRRGRTLARRDPGLMYGLVLVVVDDGEVEVRVWQPKDDLSEVVGDVLKAVTAAGETALGEVSKAVAGAVAARGELTTRRSTGEPRS